MEKLFLKYSGTDSGLPRIEFKNTGSSSNAGSILFIKDRSGTPADDDKLGKIILQGKDALGNALEDFAQIIFSSSDVTSGGEDGKIEFKTKNSGEASLRELLTLESNQITCGGFMKPRLDVIFGDYSPAGSNSAKNIKDDNFYKLVETSGILDGSIMLPGAADSNTAYYPIIQPWGNTTTTTYTKTIDFSTVTDYSILAPGSLGTYFYYITGSTGGSPKRIFLPTAVSNTIIVLVLSFTFGPTNNDHSVGIGESIDQGINFVDLDNNSVAITKPSPKVATKDIATAEFLKINKSGATGIGTTETSTVSGYVYCRPGAGSYQIISVIMSHCSSNHYGDENTVSQSFSS